MIANLKPYPAYKDSGVPWLGEVPEHWGVRRLKSLASSIIEQTNERECDEIYVALEHIESWTGRLRKVETEINFDSQVKRFRAGDLLFGKLRPYLAKVTCPDRHGVCVGEFLVLRPINSTLSPGYLEQLIRSKPIIDAISASTFGARMPRADWQFIGGMSIPFPPIQEQAAIVRFLDHVDRRILRYIRAKQTLIKLLEEQKQAIIHRAVTRGLDSNVRLKPCGVEWLGEVPAHWEVTRLKFIAAQIVDCLHATPAYSATGEYPAIRTADVQPGRLLLESARRVDEEHYLRWAARMAPEEGDILYTREGERFGIAALVPANVRVCISQRMMAFRIHPIHNSAYIMWQINCQHIYEQAAADLIGAAAPHVNVERIKNFWLVLPPGPEQEMIVAAVTRAHAGPNTAIARAHDEISLLREYRTRLIADVVTGKLDVREVAARLPDEAEELEPLDEAEALSDADEDAADDLDAASEEDEP